MKDKRWEPCEWPFDPDYAKKIAGKVWVCAVRGGHIYLRDEKHFPFVASFGANSDASFSGCHFNSPEVVTLEEAMAATLKKVFEFNRWNM